jgi:hypothetical protein
MPCEQVGDASGVDENVFVVLAVAPPGPVAVGHERGDVSDEPVRGRERELGDDRPVGSCPSQVAGVLAS